MLLRTSLWTQLNRNHSHVEPVIDRQAKPYEVQRNTLDTRRDTYYFQEGDTHLHWCYQNEPLRNYLSWQRGVQWDMDPDHRAPPELDGFSLVLPLPYRIAVILVAGMGSSSGSQVVPLLGVGVFLGWALMCA